MSSKSIFLQLRELVCVKIAPIGDSIRDYEIWDEVLIKEKKDGCSPYQDK
jgi:hypothetical protein